MFNTDSFLGNKKSSLRCLAARNLMLSGTDSKNALFPRMTKANHDELEAFMLSFYHHH
jgi:hypothetical protein